jgi:hypothetical protein
MRSLLLLIASVACAATNQISVTETTGSAQTDRPFSISRVFAKGEIAAYARPVVQGATPAVWQCDRMTTWDDGSLRHAVISFKDSLSGSELRTTTFVNNANPCSSGDATACNAAALTQQQMLDFGGGTWQGTTAITNGMTLTADARTMLAAGSWRWWLRGPAVSQVIVEDRTSARAYDMGWDAYESLHPAFILTFHAGWAGVKIDYILENTWLTSVQNQSYSVSLSNSGGVIYSKATFTHQALARWRLPLYRDDPAFWDGTAPGDVKIDYNFPYIVQSGALPSYDTTRIVSESNIVAEVALLSTRDPSLGDIMGTGTTFSGSWYKPYASVNPESPFYSWETRYLYTFDPRLETVVHRNANVSGYVPIHYREGLTGRNFSDLDGSDAFGRPVSKDARPTVRDLGRSQSSVLPADAPTIVGTRTMNSWFPDTAHQYAMTYIAYLVSGDYYYLEELYFWASWSLTRANPPANSGSTNAGHGNWANIAPGEEIRGEAWAMRSVALAAFMAPDSSPERVYYTEKLNNNIAIREGRYGIEDGNYYEPCTTMPFNALTETSKWCWGKYLVGENGKANPLHMLHPGSAGVDSGMHAAQVGTGSSPWMWNFVHHVFGWLDTGLDFTQINPLRTTLILHLLHQLRDPDFNPYLTDSYQNPVKTPAVGGPYFSSWADLKAVYLEPDRPAFNSTSSIGYVARAISAAIYLPGVDDGALIGQEGWDWLHSQASAVYASQNSLGDYTYAFTPISAAPADPPEITTTAVPAGSVGVVYDYTLEATGGGTIAWTITAGALPTGISLTSPGVLSGTPTTGGSYTFTVTATNSAGSDSQGFTLSIGQASLFSGMSVSGMTIVK